MSILVTGFEPFGGRDFNPSAELADRLGDVAIPVVLPVEFAPLHQRVAELLAHHQPRFVVCLGLSRSATSLTLERVGVNLIDARIPDNAGMQPVDVPVILGAPTAHLSSLPLKAMIQAICHAGVPASLSLSAGAYVCNALLFTVLEVANALPLAERPRCGFIHLPPPEALDLKAQERGLRAALASVEAKEIHFPDGALD